MLNKTCFSTELGVISVEDDGRALTKIKFEPPAALHETQAPSPLAQRTIKQLSEYFAGSRRAFSLPLAPQGTPFMLEVWQALLNIPYGEVRAYRDIAQLIGRPKAARAVGMANNRNPLPIVIPCHRVVGADGGLVGYVGGLLLKEKLLFIESGRQKCRDSENRT